MPTVTIGTRRLYDALGLGAPASGESISKTLFANGKLVTVYLGPAPTMGILTIEASDYGIPDRHSKLIETSATYEAPCFLELIVSTTEDISESELELLKAEDAKARERLFSLVRVDSKATEHLFDVISGVLGLRFHKQFVLKPLIEHTFISGDFAGVSSFVGPFVEMLERMTPNAGIQPAIQEMMDSMSDATADVLKNASSILFWLLRAWRERDPVSKFMFLFIPLESILPTSAGIAAESQASLDALAALVNASEADNKDDLLGFIERAKTKFNPPLTARFEEYAKNAAIPGWEVDVAAFKKFNRMRNLLLHAGQRNVSSHIDIEKNTRTLEDLVERYVAFELLGNGDVYRSTWRPQRPLTVSLTSNREQQ